MTKFGVVTQVVEKRAYRGLATPPSQEEEPQRLQNYLGPLPMPKRFDVE